jgi:hypothetical protein
MMNGRRYWPRWNVAARALVALALVLVAFAHKPLGLSGDADALAYVLPDGQVPVICTTIPDDRGTGRTLHATACDACLICGSVLVPAPAAMKVPQPIASVALAVPLAAPVLMRAAWPPSAPPHAPPAA